MLRSLGIIMINCIALYWARGDDNDDVEIIQ